MAFKGRDLAAIELFDGFGQRSLIQFNALVPNASVAPDRFASGAARRRRHRLALTALRSCPTTSPDRDPGGRFWVGMVLGWAARLRLPPLVGICWPAAIGPYTPALLAIWRWLGSWLKSA